MKMGRVEHQLIIFPEPFKKRATSIRDVWCDGAPFFHNFANTTVPSIASNKRFSVASIGIKQVSIGVGSG
jgi:hypothetical protein